MKELFFGLGLLSGIMVGNFWDSADMESLKQENIKLNIMVEKYEEVVNKCDIVTNDLIDILTNTQGGV